MRTVIGGDDESQDFDQNKCDGLCGPIDFDHIFVHIPDEAPDERDFDDENFFHLLLDQAGRAMYKCQMEAALSLFEQAYDLARNNKALGTDCCFGVMCQLHYFNFDQHAFRMCTEITQAALELKDTDLLRDVWRILPEIGIPGDVLNEAALILRDGIEARHPEVMNYTDRTFRFI
jgi:hypothetical protein